MQDIPQRPNKKWFEFDAELKRRYADQTWIPLRQSSEIIRGESMQRPPYLEETIAIGTVAFPPENFEIASELGWSDIGLMHDANSHAFRDGTYMRCDEYRRNDKETIGVNLVIVQRGTRKQNSIWHVNQDMLVALNLIKDGDNWVAPANDYEIAIRETKNPDGRYSGIEIKKSYLLDYLSARNLHLRIASYRQRVEIAKELQATPYDKIQEVSEDREGARFGLRVSSLDAVYGGSFAVFKVWRTDFDNEQDGPELGPETDENTEHESFTGSRNGGDGFRIEGEYWREEWIKNSGRSEIIRGDDPVDFPKFIVKSGEAPVSSKDLNYEEIGKWLWFKPTAIHDFLRRKDFNLEWYTADTGGLHTPNGYRVHFGINEASLVAVYAHDIARLPNWEQKIWLGHNCDPEGGIGKELEAAQIKSTPADTKSAETNLVHGVTEFDSSFRRIFGESCFFKLEKTVNDLLILSRFDGLSEPSLLKLAKDLYRAIFEGLNIDVLRKQAAVSDTKVGSIKLIEKIIQSVVTVDLSRATTGPLAGLYDLRVADAHFAPSKKEDAYKLLKIDRGQSPILQASGLFESVGFSFFQICKIMDRTP